MIHAALSYEALQRFTEALSNLTRPCSVALRRTPGLCLGANMFFLMYTADLIGLVTRHGLCTHLYADDTQVYGFCSPCKSGDLQSQLSTCVEDIAKWMGANS